MTQNLLFNSLKAMRGFWRAGGRAVGRNSLSLASKLKLNSFRVAAPDGKEIGGINLNSFED